MIESFQKPGFLPALRIVAGFALMFLPQPGLAARSRPVIIAHRGASGYLPEHTLAAKAPAWHRQQGQDISRIVLEVLARYGYQTKADPVWLQCAEFEELCRIFFLEAGVDGAFTDFPDRALAVAETLKQVVTP